MQFQDYNEIPDSGLKVWLEGSACDVLRGNFRDLDKIVINWHNHRCMNTTESDILKIIKDGFNTDLSYPKQNEDKSNLFTFSLEDKGSGNAERRFKSEYKMWIRKKFGSLQEGCEQLELKLRTVEAW